MEIKLRVDGMSCQHCAGRVKTAIESYPDAQKVEVLLDRKEARFTARIDDQALEAMINRIKELGFSVARIS